MRGEDQAHLSASSLGTVITRWIFFYPPFPHGKTSSPSPLLPELVLFCKKKKTFIWAIVREYFVVKEIPRQLAGCSSHLYVVESCRRWTPPRHQYLHPSVPSLPGCAGQHEQTVGRGQAGGSGGISMCLTLPHPCWQKFGS